jgi:AcrR family transcriptional regulator
MRSTRTRRPLLTPDQAFEERAIRRDGHEELPAGPKARRTRATILEAALARFEADGYLRTSMNDVASAAGVSLGTVYQYFHDRADVVAALLQEAVTTMLGRADTAWRAAEGRAGLYRVIHNFVASYSEVAAIAGVWEEVSHIDDDLAELRRSLGRIFTEQVERELRRAARLAQVRSNLDPVLTARALTGMVDRYCYVTYVFDPPEDGPPTPEQSAELLTELWASAVGLAT